MGAAIKLVSKVKNGVIPLPRGLKLADGSDVAVIPLVALPTDPRFLKVALKLAKPRALPPDVTLKHKRRVARRRAT